MSWLPNELEDFDTIILSLLNDLDEKRKFNCFYVEKSTFFTCCLNSIFGENERDG